jgi:putative intracellular protease/amidase
MMKKIELSIKKAFATVNLVLLFILVVTACRPVRNLKNPSLPWQGDSQYKSKIVDYNVNKKNVFIIADAKMTVMFDMLAPFYLFNSTGKANVYIIAKDKTPILVKRDLFVQPQLTFEEADSMKLHADVIVIPALSKRDEHQDTELIHWIMVHFLENTKMLAICDGASTAAATGLYDGKPLTCHASDYAVLKKCFRGPDWVQNIAVTQSGNLFSTAGVSNAVEGSLTVINELFGRECMQKAMADINYPLVDIKSKHTSRAINDSDKFGIAKKIIFKKNKKIGLLMENGMNEFDMASVLEIYGRTFPASLSAISFNSPTIETKYGLTLIIRRNENVKGLNELHVLVPESISKEEELYFRNIQMIRYDKLEKQYLVDICLKRIVQQYGHQLESVVKKSLDYN